MVHVKNIIKLKCLIFENVFILLNSQFKLQLRINYGIKMGTRFIA